jgi:hypothetical protein
MGNKTPQSELAKQSAIARERQKHEYIIASIAEEKKKQEKFEEERNWIINNFEYLLIQYQKSVDTFVQQAVKQGKTKTSFRSNSILIEDASIHSVAGPLQVLIASHIKDSNRLVAPRGAKLKWSRVTSS